MGPQFNPIALRMAKTLWSFECSESNRVKVSSKRPDKQGIEIAIHGLVVLHHIHYTMDVKRAELLPIKEYSFHFT